ncbi:hypothetical protein R1sor_014977 [Riccia sorocarpa]|uniref:Uncharacterized protein n=1 Tax=Riccia sorocarpa TaxID=122646 RepID=A0ABD3HAX1_9MARC
MVRRARTSENYIWLRAIVLCVVADIHRVHSGYLGLGCEAYVWEQHKSECRIWVKPNEEKQMTPPLSLQLVIRLMIKRNLRGAELQKAFVNFAMTRVDYNETWIVQLQPDKTIVAPAEVDLKKFGSCFAGFIGKFAHQKPVTVSLFKRKRDVVRALQEIDKGSEVETPLLFLEMEF